MLDGSSRRLGDLLAAAGCRLEDPDNQDCCGALAAHTGRAERADSLKRLNREAFAGALGGLLSEQVFSYADVKSLPEAF